MDKKENLTQEQKKKAMEEAYRKYLLQMLEEKREREKAEAEAKADAVANVEAEPEPETKVEATANVDNEAKVEDAPLADILAKPVKAENSGVAAYKAEPENKPEKKPQKKKKEKKVKEKKAKKQKPEKSDKAKKSLAVRAIDAYDRRMAKLDDAFIMAYRGFVDEIFKAIRKYREARVSISKDFLIIVLLCCGLFIVFNNCLVYEYAYNGRVLGYVSDQSNVTDVLSVAGDHLSSNNKVNVEFVANENITFRLVSAEGRTMDSSDEAVNKLAFMTDVEITACGIYEDGELKAITESESSAELAVNTAINKLSLPDDGMEKISAETTKAITFEEIDVMLTSVLSEYQTAKALEKGGEQKIYHIVLEGETLASICKTYGVKSDDIYDENDEKQISSVSAGQKICVHKTIEALEVKVVEKGTMVEVLPFRTIEKESDQVYKGDTQVEVEGVDGRRTITGKVTKVGGKIVKRNLTKTETIIKRVDKVVLIGTADKPKEAPTGTYKLPITSYVYISDQYGPRWGKIHEGVDFAASTGTVILAADGGTITEAGWADSYGYRVIVDHGNGNTTWYCHCSELYYEAGTKVYQGQPIAEVGSTGYSTGPHLHFEIRVNGEAVDPGPILGVY